MKKFAIALLTLVMMLSLTLVAACSSPCEHVWEETSNTATCTTDGTKTFTCSECEETKTEASQKTGHNMSAYEVTTAAVCNTPGVKTSTCQNEGCNYSTTQTIMAPGHNIYDPSCRILFWNGSGNNINYHSVCMDCGGIDTAESSLGNYRTLDKLFAPLPTDQNAIFSFYKVVYVYNYDVSFSVMKDGQLMEIGQADQAAKACTIDVAASTTGASEANIAGDIIVVNGKLTIKGDVNFSGSIVVKAGSTLVIDSTANIANSGSITVEAGATLTNNGTVTGTAIVNQNS
ncbi:MAG: hypothetical protein IJV77_05735 [Clostridia bacterium]|nr:hypothetical protein [Clostridia bacterium]